MGVSSLSPKWKLGGNYGRVGLSAFMPTTETQVMPEFGVAVGSSTGDASSPYDSGTFTETHAGVRFFAAPYDFTGYMAMQTAVPYVAAGLTFLQADLKDNFGNMESDGTLGVYVRAGMTMGDFFAVEGRYVLAPDLKLFGQDLSLNGPQASVWIRLDVIILIALKQGDHH